MSNFNENDPKSVASFVLDNLPRHKQFALATVDSEGAPWCVCLNLSYDSDVNIIWKSLKDTQHSEHIKKNPQVSITVFSETEDVGDFGFYTKAVAHEVVDTNELKRLLEVRFRGKTVPPVEDFLDESPLRIYVATIEAAWVNDDRHNKSEVDLLTLRALAR